MTGRDFRDVYAGLKDFQLATVDHVVSRMYEDDRPTDRFLVADEVGLGKTLVARGVIARSIEHHLERGTRRIDIVYICSNGDIARQNINRLNVLGRDDVQLASRITLLPRILHQLEKHRVNFVSFTPGTSFNLRSSQGVVNERVLLFHLLADHWPDAMRSAGARKALAGGASFENFEGYLKRMGRSDLDDTMAAGFHRALERQEDVLKQRGKKTNREQLEELTNQLRWARRNTADAVGPETMSARAAFVGGLRELLAQVCVDALEPDLVILDEFQRFKHVFDEERPEGQLATRLFNYRDDDDERVKILLLSATPYKMYTLSEEAEEDHYADFLDTLKFLLPDTEIAALSADLREYRQALWRIGDDGGAMARAVRERIEHHLRAVMCRTERLAVTANRDGMLTERPATGVQLQGDDVHRFLTLEHVSEEIGGYGMLPYWMSAPYPLNFMERYKLDEKLDAAIEVGAPRRLRQLLGTDGLLLPWADIEAYEKVDPGNARMRGLLADTVDRGMWRLLWMRPALPYYELGEPFSDPSLDGATKRLVFSSWAVVPKVVAAMATYEAERHMMTSFSPDATNTPPARARITELLRFQRSQGRLTGMPVLALLYPSIALSRLADPLEIAGLLGGVDRPVPQDVLLKQVADRLREPLSELTDGAPTDGTEDARWYWAVPFLLDHQAEGEAFLDWLDPDYLALPSRDDDEGHDETVSRGLVAHYEEVRRLVSRELEPLGRPPADLVDVIAELAVAGPGVATLRALQRLGIDDIDDANMHARDYALTIAYGFRSLFNEPEVQYLLRGAAGRGHREDTYWRLVLRYCVDGCLQAVMDEFAHTLVESLGVADLTGWNRFHPLADHIYETLTMRTTSYGVRRIDVAPRSVQASTARLRGKFAVRFGDDRSEDEKTLARSSTVRKAFNSPFRPFVLATTSVGQEGLDFHTYCHAIVHWNLPGNPVDMEQREGRVHRYKGHAVRKNVAVKHRSAAFSGAGDPWAHLFAEASTHRRDADNELVPYWVFPLEGGASIERYVPALPLSRDARQLERLRRSMAAYRLVFGQPRQEDLVAFLSERIEADDLSAVMGDLRIDLAPPPLFRGRREELITLPRIEVPVTSDGAEEKTGNSGSGLSPRRELYREFWDSVLSDIKRRYPGWTRSNGSSDSWFPLPAGTSGIFYTMVFGRGLLRLELYVDPGGGMSQERAWAELVSQRAAIESRFGVPLVWEELPSMRASRIGWYYDREDVDIADTSRWDEYRDWILQHLGPFRDAVQPAVDELRGSAT